MSEKPDPISSFLGMKSIEEVLANKNEIIEYRENVPAIHEIPVDSRKDEDFEEARTLVKKVIEIGETAIENMANIAEQSQNPVAYEKLGALINAMTGASKTLMDLHKSKKAIDKVDQDNPGIKDDAKPAGEVHNHLYVGSTAELADFISNMNEKKNVQ